MVSLRSNRYLYFLNFRTPAMRSVAIVNLSPALKKGGNANMDNLIASQVVPQMAHITM